MTAGLIVKSLFKSYPGAEGALAVLRGASFSLLPGESAAIRGPSGSGKSTLLSILGALETPDAGEALLDGVNPHSLEPKALAKWRNQEVGFVFQEHLLLDYLTALENVLTPTLAGFEWKNLEEAPVARATRLLDSLGLLPRINQYPHQLSGGERQRVAIARALINRPKLLLCDEPTGNLDAKSAHSVAGMLLDMAREQGAILVAATHSEALAKSFLKSYTLEEGELK